MVFPAVLAMAGSRSGAAWYAEPAASTLLLLVRFAPKATNKNCFSLEPCYTWLSLLQTYGSHSSLSPIAAYPSVVWIQTYTCAGVTQQVHPTHAAVVRMLPHTLA